MSGTPTGWSAPMDERYWSSLQAAQSAQIKPGGSITFTIGATLFHPVKKWTLNIGPVGALDAATRSLAVELAPIRVNVVCPGLRQVDLHGSPHEVVTSYDILPIIQLFDRIPLPGGREKFMRGLDKNHLVGHVGTADEIAEAYLFLMKCGFITGETIKVDGGSMLEASLQF
ncbi:NAD(P)-binding protein [Fistulina hepatica ATCC 64428]|uniref:NAD(P)-binding protein n=1 Tax=Fistulina hepatica ATCC 64428 TaxID=1128425 RepID=A0A0D7A1J2_9AGAR|nr:NAD(P)-binding protein [Fistulina hepatica ATCC 64428]